MSAALSLAFKGKPILESMCGIFFYKDVKFIEIAYSLNLISMAKSKISLEYFYSPSPIPPRPPTPFSFNFNADFQKKKQKKKKNIAEIHFTPSYLELWVIMLIK